MAKPELDETGMNASGTCAGASTNGARSVRYEIVDSSGNTLGPYFSLVEAEAHARLYGTDQDDGHWDVQGVGADR